MEAAQAENQKSRYTELQAEAKKQEDIEKAQRDGEPDTEFDSEEVKTAAELKAELRFTKDKVEELEIKTRVYRKATTDKANAMREQLQQMRERRDELETIVNGAEKKADAPAPEDPNAEDEPATKKAKAKGPSAQAAAQAQAKASAGALTHILKGPLMQLLMRTVTGVMAISLYFADLISDLQVLQLLYDAGTYSWAAMSLFLLIAQFLVVYLRVIPYLSSTFGSDSTLYISFLWGGFPIGLLLLDFLMFLEPFGLLSVLPFPEWLRQFVPAYKATRIIAEILIESLPQSAQRASN